MAKISARALRSLPFLDPPFRNPASATVVDRYTVSLPSVRTHIYASRRIGYGKADCVYVCMYSSGCIATKTNSF